MLNHKSLGSVLIGLSIILLVILAFIKFDLDERDVFLCEAVHENDLDMSKCPAHQSNTSWLMVIVLGISFIILGGGIYLVFLPVAREVNGRKQVDLSKLDTEEKKIISLLNEHEGSMYQSDLIKETNFSKVHITRLLDKLETKNVVDRKRRGMTNIVVLK